MSLRGLDEFLTGHWGEDYWGDQEDEPDAFVCEQCRSSAHSWCKGGNAPHGCSCPYRYGKTAAEHGPYKGPVKLVMDSPSGGAETARSWQPERMPLARSRILTLNDNTGASLNDSKGK